MQNGDQAVTPPWTLRNLIYGCYVLLCATALVWPGLLTAECPVGDVVPGVAFTASDLRRGAPGRIAVLPVGWFTWGPADLAERARGAQHRRGKGCSFAWKLERRFHHKHQEASARARAASLHIRRSYQTH